jgi:hypothetical protein
VEFRCLQLVLTRISVGGGGGGDMRFGGRGGGGLPLGTVFVAELESHFQMRFGQKILKVHSRGQREKKKK